MGLGGGREGRTGLRVEHHCSMMLQPKFATMGASSNQVCATSKGRAVAVAVVKWGSRDCEKVQRGRVVKAGECLPLPIPMRDHF